MGFWEDIFIPIAIGPIFIVGKYMWDLYYDREQDILRRKHEKQMEEWETNVKQFYWPLYLTLIENQQLWKYVLQNKYVEGTYRNICKDDESSEDEEGGSIIMNNDIISGKLCAFKYENGMQCGVYLSKNQKKLFGSYCMAHFPYMKHTMSARTKKTWKSSDASNVMVNHIPLPVSDLTTHISPTQICQQILENQDKMLQIIEESLPKINTKDKLGTYIVQFRQYAAQFKILNQNCKDTIINPRKDGTYYPKKLLSYLEYELFTTQQKLIERSNNFYKELDKDSSVSSYQWLCGLCGFSSCCADRVSSTSGGSRG